MPAWGYSSGDIRFRDEPSNYSWQTMQYQSPETASHRHSHTSYLKSTTHPIYKDIQQHNGRLDLSQSYQATWWMKTSSLPNSPPVSKCSTSSTWNNKQLQPLQRLTTMPGSDEPSYDSPKHSSTSPTQGKRCFIGVTRQEVQDQRSGGRAQPSSRWPSQAGQVQPQACSWHNSSQSISRTLTTKYTPHDHHWRLHHHYHIQSKTSTRSRAQPKTQHFTTISTRATKGKGKKLWPKMRKRTPLRKKHHHQIPTESNQWPSLTQRITGTSPKTVSLGSEFTYNHDVNCLYPLKTPMCHAWHSGMIDLQPSGDHQEITATLPEVCDARWLDWRHCGPRDALQLDRHHHLHNPNQSQFHPHYRNTTNHYQQFPNRSEHSYNRGYDHRNRPWAQPQRRSTSNSINTNRLNRDARSTNHCGNTPNGKHTSHTCAPTATLPAQAAGRNLWTTQSTNWQARDTVSIPPTPWHGHLWP